MRRDADQPDPTTRRVKAAPKAPIPNRPARHAGEHECVDSPFDVLVEVLFEVGQETTRKRHLTYLVGLRRTEGEDVVDLGQAFGDHELAPEDADVLAAQRQRFVDS